MHTYPWCYITLLANFKEAAVTNALHIRVPIVIIMVYKVIGHIGLTIL